MKFHPRRPRGSQSGREKRRDERAPGCYGRPFVSKLCHDIRAFFCHVYLRSFLLCGVFIPKYIHIYAHKKSPHIYALQTSMCIGVTEHRRTGRGGEGELQPPQILGSSDFLGSERKFGQSQFLKTSPCLFNYFKDLNINLKSA